MVKEKGGEDKQDKARQGKARQDKAVPVLGDRTDSGQLRAPLLH